MGLLPAVMGGCGGQSAEAPADATTDDRETAWSALLAERGLDPARGLVVVKATKNETPDLDVALRVPGDANGELTFADALYGAEAYAFDGSWRRVDTADLRAEVAPILRPGEMATLELPVEEVGDVYRVLVPVAGRAAWGETPGA